MNLSLSQATRFYETLALLIARKEGVDIKVMVTPRKEAEYGGQQDGKIYHSVQEYRAV